jgi:large subunit ribosomal protein L41
MSPSNIAITLHRAFTCSSSHYAVFRGTSISSLTLNMGKLSIGSRLLDDIPASTSNPSQETRRNMSKYLSKSATKRLPLNTKRAKKGYYKGKGSTSEGRLTSKGRFIADPLKKVQLIVPDLTGFPLKPYIAKTISKIPPENRIDIPGQ